MTDQDAQWIRERLDWANRAYNEWYANRVAHEHTVRRGTELAEAVLRDVRKLDHDADCLRDPFMGPDPACPACVPGEETGPTIPCPKCGEPMLDDGVFETCGYCAEGE